jgi:hypothetical protein
LTRTNNSIYSTINENRTASRFSYLSLVISDVGPVVAGIDAALVDHDGVEVELELTKLLN